jgi:hypothetical protein
MWGIRGDEERKHDRWLGAVVAVLGQPRLQFLHPRQQRRHLLAQPGVLSFQLGVACFQRQVSMLLLLHKSA